MACVRLQESATGHYERSFDTISEIAISWAMAAKSRPKRLEFISAQAATTDTDTDTESLLFAEFVILILWARQPNAV